MLNGQIPIDKCKSGKRNQRLSSGAISEIQIATFVSLIEIENVIWILHQSERYNLRHFQQKIGKAQTLLNFNGKSTVKSPAAVHKLGRVIPPESDSLPGPDKSAILCHWQLGLRPGAGQRYAFLVRNEQV